MASQYIPPPLPRRFDISEMAQEAAERAGIEFRSGYALTTARRSLELLQIEWANRGLNLWCIERWESPILAALPNQLTLPADTVDILDAFLETPASYNGSLGGSVVWLSRAGLGDAPTLYRTLTPSRPNTYFVHRTVEPPTVEFAPSFRADDLTPYVFVCWRLRYMRNLQPGGTDIPEMPSRFMPAMIAGLAYKLALKSKDTSRVAMLKSLYEEEFDLASQEDRDRASVRLLPERSYY